MESIDIATKLIGGLAAIFGIALTLSHLLAQKSTGKIKKYEIYKEVKSHFDDSPEKNFPLICAALNCLIDRKCSGQLNLATALESSQNLRSDSFGLNPAL